MKLNKLKLLITIKLIIISINFVLSVFQDSNKNNVKKETRVEGLRYLDKITIYSATKDITSFSKNIQFLLKKYNNKTPLILFKLCFLHNKYQMLFNIISDRNLKILNSKKKYNKKKEKEETDTKQVSFKNIFKYINFIKANGQITKNISNIKKKFVELVNGKLIFDFDDKHENKKQPDLQYEFKTLDNDIIERYKNILDLENIIKNRNEKDKRIIEFSKYLIYDKKIFDNFDYNNNKYLLDFFEISKELVKKYNEIIEIGLKDIKIDKTNMKYFLFNYSLNELNVKNYDNKIDTNEIINLMQLITNNLNRFDELLKVYEKDKNKDLKEKINNFDIYLFHIHIKINILINRIDLISNLINSTNTNYWYHDNYMKLDSDKKINNAIEKRIHIIMLTGIIIKEFSNFYETQFIDSIIKLFSKKKIQD